MELTLCDGCGRHIRSSEGRCPFCKRERLASADVAAELDPPRVSRAALVLGAAMALSACDRSGTSGGTGGGSSIVQPYGAPIPPQPDAGEQRIAAPMYGLPPSQLPGYDAGAPSIAQPYGAPMQQEDPTIVVADAAVPARADAARRGR